MKVVYTDEAVSDPDTIFRYTAEQYPGVLARFQVRLRTAAARISACPSSAPRVHDYSELRTVNLAPYPYRLFYRVKEERVEILHIRHAARRLPWEESQ
jgi:plasmid stabilization system protein ParE